MQLANRRQGVWFFIQFQGGTLICEFVLLPYVPDTAVQRPASRGSSFKVIAQAGFHKSEVYLYRGPGHW